MLNAIRIIAERKISQAIRDGELTVESWKGRPLPMEDDRLIPPDLKMAYKIMKNSGFLPPEIEAKKEVQRLEQLIAATEDEHVRVKQIRKLNILILKLNTMRQRAVNLEDSDYHQKVVEKISVTSSSKD